MIKNMKKIFTALMLVASVFTVSARELHADLSQATKAGANATWDAATGTFSWTAGNDARLLITDILEDGDLSEWVNLVLVTSSYTDSYRIDVELQDGTVIQGTNAWGKFYSAGTKTLVLANGLAADQITNVKNIRLNTNSGSGSIVLEDLYLQNDEPEPVVFSAVCQGFVAVKNNNQCSYDATTNTFAWTAANANTMQIFAFDAGKLAEFNTLELVTSDFQSENEVGQYDLKYRVLFMAANDSKVKEKSFSSVGTKTITLADEMKAGQIASIVEIRFAGACAQGSLKVVPADIQLKGEGEGGTTAVENVQYETNKAFKVIENGQIVIIRNGVRFDVTGKAL